MSESQNDSELERLLSLLLSRGVEFLVIGGFAEELLIGGHPTADVDICYRRDPTNLERLAECLRSLHARLRGAPEGLPFILDRQSLQNGWNFTFRTDLGDLDLIGFVEPFGEYEKLLQNHEQIEFGAGVVRVIGLDDLLKVKLHINRAKDQNSIARLQAAKRLRAKDKRKR